MFHRGFVFSIVHKIYLKQLSKCFTLSYTLCHTYLFTYIISFLFYIGLGNSISISLKVMSYMAMSPVRQSPYIPNARKFNLFFFIFTLTPNSLHF